MSTSATTNSNPQNLTAEDGRPTTDSFMLAGYEFAIDLDATAIVFEDDRVRSFRIQGDTEVFGQMTRDSAFPFDFAKTPPVLYAAGVHDTKGQAERVGTDEAIEDGGTAADGTAHGAYLDFGGEHDVELVVLARDGWVFIEGSATIGGNEYELEVRVGVGS